MSVDIRPAGPADIPAIHAIFSHYVLNSIASFAINKPPPEYIASRYETARSCNLPYLVAIDSASGDIVGYSSAGAFHGHMLGYVHAVEISLFCHPEHRSRGAGSKLLENLLEQLQTTKHKRWEEGHEDKAMEVFVTKVLAIMSVDDQAPGGGLMLRDWYVSKWGFEQVGRLKGIGWKHGRELDTIYLMKDLRS